MYIPVVIIIIISFIIIIIVVVIIIIIMIIKVIIVITWMFLYKHLRNRPLFQGLNYRYREINNDSEYLSFCFSVILSVISNFFRFLLV